MRRRAATSRITLQAKAVPASGENTELNYRTCITTSSQDRNTTIRLASIVTLTFIVIGFGLRLLASLPYLVTIPLLVILFALSLVLAHWKFLRARPTTFEGFLALAIVAVSVLFGFVNYAPTMGSAYLWVFGPAVIAAATLSHYVTLQACAFMAVNERIPRLRMRRWLNLLRRMDTLAIPPECPELLSYRVSFVLLLVAFAFGYFVLLETEKTEHASYAAMFGVLAFVGSLPVIKLVAGFVLRVPIAPLPGTVKATWKAIKTFTCYNRHGIQAAGLFLFPTKALRLSPIRDVVIGLTLAFLTTALVGVSVSSPSVLIEQYRNAPKKSEVKPEDFRLTATEEQFSRALSPESQSQYFEAKKREHEAAQVETRWDGAKRTAWNILIATGFVLVLCWLGPSLVLFAIIWFTGGELLCRYHLALEASDAYEVPPKPTKEEIAKGKRSILPWDNRIDRIRCSADELETEHYYLGSSIEGDFPVLLHQDLLYRHAHILGDTGSRKTSIGLAPLITQLVNRENCSIVIIDLKGDRALFNAVKDEAGAVGLPFKHFTNIVGKSSHVFNPLRQSHLPNMTTDQLTQGILQALELEHGEGYGRGHYTALNDCVLSAYFRKHRRHVGSFKELHKLVSDRSAYRNISNNEEDWRQTRQLVNLVEKIANLGPMNATAENLKEKPQAIEQQIDMASVLKTPQVVYFYLSSSLDPRTVSPAAKLAMFSLLNAAEFRDGVNPRTYVFIDEFQRVISEAMTLFFEQARSKGLHFILANQSIGQLKSKGVDITDVVESTAGFKQSFKASDEKSIKRILETSGEAVYHSLSWSRTIYDSIGEDSPDLISLENATGWSPDGVKVNVIEQYGPRMERNTLIEVSAAPLASFIRFTEGSGYTQYSGYWTTLLSEYHLTKPLYDYYEAEPLPPVSDATIAVPGDPADVEARSQIIETPIPNGPNVPAAFEDDLIRRINADDDPSHPPNTPPKGT